MKRYNFRKRPDPVGVEVRTGEIGKALSDPFAFVWLRLSDVCRCLNVESKYDFFLSTEDDFELTEFERSLHYFECEDGKEVEFVDLHGIWTLAAAGETKDKRRVADFVTWVFRDVASELFRKEAYKLEDVAIMFSHSLSGREETDDEAMKRVSDGIASLHSLLKDEEEDLIINLKKNKKMKTQRFNRLKKWLCALPQEGRDSLLKCTLNDTEELLKLFDYAAEDDIALNSVSKIAENFDLSAVQLNNILCAFGIVRREEKNVILCDEFADFGKQIVWENRETTRVARKYEKFYFRGVVLIRNLWSNLRVAFLQSTLQRDDDVVDEAEE